MHQVVPSELAVASWECKFPDSFGKNDYRDENSAMQSDWSEWLHSKKANFWGSSGIVRGGGCGKRWVDICWARS